jgi:hypothetical protein
MPVSVSETLLFSLKISRFAICRLGHQGNLQICELILKTLRISYLWTGTPQKFADLFLRNEPKNLRICNLQTNKQNLPAHLCQCHEILLGFLAGEVEWNILQSRNVLS